MKRTIAGVLLLIGIGAGTMFAEDGLRKRRDVRHDEARISYERREMRRDFRNGEYREARHKRWEMRREYRDANRDRRELGWR